MQRAVDSARLLGAQPAVAKSDSPLTAIYECRFEGTKEEMQQALVEGWGNRSCTTLQAERHPGFLIVSMKQLAELGLEGGELSVCKRLIDPMATSVKPLVAVDDDTPHEDSFRFNPIYEAREDGIDPGPTKASLMALFPACDGPPVEAAVPLLAALHLQLGEEVDHEEDVAAPIAMRPTKGGLGFESSNEQAGMDAVFRSADDLIPEVDDPLEYLRRITASSEQLLGEDLKKEQEDDDFCKKWMAFLRDSSLPEDGREAKRMQSEHDSYVLQDGLLKRVVTNEQKREMLVTVLPESQRQVYLEAAHDRMAHQGRSRTLQSLRHRVWWPGMKDSVKEFTRNCPTCCFNREVPRHGPMHMQPNGEHPWSDVQVDIVDLELTASGRCKAVVFACRLSRQIAAFPASKDIDSKAFLNIISFGFVKEKGTFPKRLYSDRGSNLISRLCQSYYEAMRIEHEAGDSYMHTVVGVCERFNHTLRLFARAVYFDEQAQWDLFLGLITLVYNAAIDPHTGHSPFYLEHGYEAVLPWEVALTGKGPKLTSQEFVQRHITALHAAWQTVQATRLADEMRRRGDHAAKYDTNVKFERGDRVLVKQPRRVSKMDMPYVGPYRVEEVLDRDRYRLRDRRNVKLHNIFSVQRLKLYPISADGDLAPDDDYYVVDHIVDRRRGSTGHLEYRLRWVGYTAKDDTWEPVDSFTPALREEAAAYNHRHPIFDETDIEKIIPDPAPVAEELPPPPQAAPAPSWLGRLRHRLDPAKANPKAPAQEEGAAPDRRPPLTKRGSREASKNPPPNPMGGVRNNESA